MICSRRETILGGKLTVCHRPETLWSEQLGKNFVQQMRDALQKQLAEFETAKKKEEHDARIVANDGARRWRELKDSLKRLVEKIDEELPEEMLSHSENENGNEFTLRHELSDRTMRVTFHSPVVI